MGSSSSGGGTSTRTSTSQRDVRTGLPSQFGATLSSQLTTRFPEFFQRVQELIPFTSGGSALNPETIIQQSLTRGTGGLLNQSISGFQQLLNTTGSQFGGPAGSLATALIQSSPAATLGIANQLNQQNFLADLLRPGASSLQQLLNASALALGRGGFGSEISSGRSNFRSSGFSLLSGVGGQAAGGFIGGFAAAKGAALAG